MEIFLQFIVPILIFILAAGLIGFGLSFLGEKLKVERDPKIDDVLRYLAGINCGGCGCAGCDGFAEKLVKGEADISACNPTSGENKANIARVLGKNIGKSREMVAVVHCNGGNACRDKYAYQGFGDCQSAEILAGGSKACHVGCLGLGSCFSACKYGAIAVDRDTGVAAVKRENCASCGACLTACPKKIVSRIPADAKVYVACSNTRRGKEVRSICDNGCIACGRCEKECPEKAVSLSNNLAMIDYDKCTGCGRCAGICPSKCILEFKTGKNIVKAKEKKIKRIAGKIKKKPE
jgi:Na+-translocating ferredoxin:NAD+ oxidoreductase RNF subunit RnfB